MDPQVASVLRLLAGIVAGWLVKKGVVDGDGTSAVEALVMAIGALVWGQLHHVNTKAELRGESPVDGGTLVSEPPGQETTTTKGKA